MVQQYPGLTIKVDEIPSNPAYPDLTSQYDLYPTALMDEDFDSSYKSCATTLREKLWQDMMNMITDKPDWEDKIFNQKIASKWRTEVLQQGSEYDQGFSEAMADGLIEELKQKAELYKETGWIVSYDPGVVKSDVAVTENIKEALKAAVKPLEDLPESAKDWHPGSENKVLDLVHPSLWPLMYGFTKILDHGLECDDKPIADSGMGNTLPVITDEDVGFGYSKHFQWLPAEIEFDETTKKSKFTSYINNLHPHKHEDLYRIIEKVIDIAIPLWSRTLSSWPVKQRIMYDDVTYEDIPELAREPDETDEDYEDRSGREEWDQKRNYIIQPEPHGNKIEYNVTDLKEEFPAGLQVIVKLANIHLKPGEEYSGGTWHVEGQANEHIVATALYYYDNENIEESRLEFRKCVDESEFDEISYQQDEHWFLERVFNLANGQSTIQNVGNMLCQEGRLLTFPNMLQHRVSPFKLTDNTKPGHRKILALFLVDPHLRIISTAMVPPQRKDWWIEEMLQTKGIALMEKLPPELIHEIFSYVDFPMSLETAKEKRIELIAERSQYVKDQDSQFTSPTFSLCEH